MNCTLLRQHTRRIAHLVTGGMKRRICLVGLVLSSSFATLSAGAQEPVSLTNCDNEALTCDITLLFDWGCPAERSLTGTPFDCATELQHFDFESATQLSPFGTDCANGCVQATISEVTQPVLVETPVVDIMDDGRAMTAHRVRTVDTGSRRSEWTTITPVFIFPSDFVEAARQRDVPGVVINFTFSVQ